MKVFWSDFAIDKVTEIADYHGKQILPVDEIVE